MAELGEVVLDHLKLDSRSLKPFGNNLENWMSFLSADQPWLSPAENYENRALFTRVSDAVYRVISQAESEVIRTTELPVWLERLVWTWCDQRTQVFSFNYDTLLERAIGSLHRNSTLGDVYSVALEERHAPGDGATLAAAFPTGRLLSLHKLHGSTNWAFGGLDAPPSDRIVLVDDGLRWSPPNIEEIKWNRRDLSKFADLVPLIIPPTVTKGPFFSNLSLRAQWRSAAIGLQRTQVLTVIGYSFPAADLVAQQWASTSISGPRLDVIDRSDERPAQIREALGAPNGGAHLTGESAIQDYVERETGDHVAWSISGAGTAGVEVKLEVNGVDVLRDFEPHRLPWVIADEDAQRWVHSRVEAGGAGLLDHASGPMSGSWESRHVVLPPRRRFDMG